MLEEVVTVVDASSRQALQELAGRIGLGSVPVPSLFRALNPKLSNEDKRVSPYRSHAECWSLRNLIRFFLPDCQSNFCFSAVLVG